MHEEVIRERWPDACVTLEPPTRQFGKHLFEGIATIYKTWDDMRDYAEGDTHGESSDGDTDAERLARALLEALTNG